jgi:predicted O-methyltransferase YrrM
MNRELWTRVDRYIESTLLPADPILENALLAAEAAAVPEINVSAAQGMLLHLLARMVNARKILEIGTLAGYSTIWMARALPVDGRLVTLEIEPRYAQVARKNLESAGLESRVDILVGAAIDTLPRLQAERAGPFDFFFIDADKTSNPQYFQWALKLSRPGSVIVIDNVIRNGAVIEADSKDPSVRGVRELNEMLAAERRVTATEIQTVGSKGYDGFALVYVN